MNKLIMAMTLFATAAAAAPKPNMVLIMADDIGLGDISHHVRTFMDKEPLFETPAIDALARQGLWFTDGHSATALCSPTRYCMMSGNANYRSHAPWGVWNTFAETPFKPGEATLGTVARDAGYATGFIGKWHLGGDFKTKDGKDIFRAKDRGTPDLPVDLTRLVGGGPSYCGFDYSFMLPCGIQGPIYTAYENEHWYKLASDSVITFLDADRAINPKDITSKGPGLGDSNWDTREMGKILSQKAVDFIDGHAGKNPFFLYYCSPMAHVPHCPPDEFDGKKINGATPSRHLDCVLDLDMQVKRIIDALKKSGQFENTLIVFTSDNGGLQVDEDSLKAGHKTSGDWAGSKNSPLEGGHRVPYFAVWPGHIQPGTTDELAASQDMIATFAALTGTKIPAGQALDSNNLLPLLLNTGDFTPREILLLQAGSKNEAIYRKGSWKLIIQSNHLCTEWEPTALFNLADNPSENPKQNGVDHPKHRQLAQKMLKEYLAIRESGQRTAP